MANSNNGNKGNNTVAAVAPVAAVAAVAAVAPTVQGYRRMHPAGGVPNARASYGIAGVPGITVVDRGMFAEGVPPASIVFAHVVNGVLVPLPMATPQPRGVAHVTSAVIAAAAAQVAQVQGTALATPQQVAATAATVVGKLVAAAGK